MQGRDVAARMSGMQAEGEVVHVTVLEVLRSQYNDQHLMEGSDAV